MAEELGRVEKPPAERYKGVRKVYFVPLIFLGTDSPTEYKERVERYWEQAEEHIRNLEAKIGRVQYIYHESIALGGEAGLQVMERLNSRSCKIAREKCQNGAVLEVIEDKELVEESMDWERCLLLGFMSEKVAKMVSDFYREASQKRYEYMASRISETLKDGEAAILFLREGHRVQFPADMEVFSVAPPALDDIYRWLRDQTGKKDEAGV
ncbi:MAG: hypothetical protein HYX88_04200 [Chloroflexi bacterium]|nr:hypothetical protein [Chloroflexota bacterium]